MQKILSQVMQSCKKNGIRKTFAKIVRYISLQAMHRRKGKLWPKILEDSVPVEERFTLIYQNKMWGEGESVSGSGSSLDYTENLRAQLPQLVLQYDITTIFDAPCGDLNWMKNLLPVLGVKYIGADIVKELIDTNQKRFANENTHFLHIDIIKGEYPKADLMICRDCLFHFSYQDTIHVLENFVEAEISYLLTTTHITSLPNSDIKTGDYRTINLFDFPYQFDGAPLARIDDWVKPSIERQLCLWSRSQVASALMKMKQNLSYPLSQSMQA